MSSGFPIWSGAKWAAQPQKMARGLKFLIYGVDGVYYLHICSENKSVNQQRGHREVDLCLGITHMQNTGFLRTRPISRPVVIFLLFMFTSTRIAMFYKRSYFSKCEYSMFVCLSV